MSGKFLCVASFVLALCITTGATGAGLDDGLVGYWPLDGDAQDASGNGNHGTINGNVTPVADRLSTPNSAMNFPGNTSAYIDLGQPPMLLIKGAMTVAAWVRANTLTQNGRIFSKQGGNGTQSWGINLESAGDFAQFDLALGPASADRLRPRSEQLSFGPAEWWHIAGVFRPGNAVELYVNGRLAASETTTATEQYVDNGLSVNIGRRPQPGTPWQGDIDEVRMYNRALSSAEIPRIMKGVDERLASDPSPGDGAEDVSRDTDLSWTPGIYAAAVNGHRLYFSQTFSDANEGIGGVPLGAASYDPGRLEFETTYYWRVDEVNAPPDSTVHRGDIWSFTTEPVGYPVDSANITATASSSGETGFGPKKTIDGSGLDQDGLHSVAATDMWLSGSEPLGAWIQYEFDKVYKLHEMWVWNSNQIFEGLFGFGLKDVTVEYSTDGADWTALATVPQFTKAPGTAGYAHDTTVDFAGAGAKYVKLTATSNWGGLLPQYGLSEVRFFSIPVIAGEPSPASGAANVDPAATLTWRAGREAATHHVYLSADQQAVIDGTVPAFSVTAPSYSLVLDLSSTYYWRVDEVNDVATPPIWQGDVWSFSTPEYLVVDDFESYNNIDPPDPASHRIFESWSDGYGVAANGALVGNDLPPYAETGTVHGGRQSMPLFYSNTAGAASSETTRTFTPGQDWTKHSIQTLVLYFHGTEGSTGQLYVKVNGVKVSYPGDATDLTQPRWKQWNIDLASLGVNLTSITSLALGIGGNGAAGTLYIDDIVLYRWAPSASSQEIYIEAEAAAPLGTSWRLYNDPASSGGSHIGSQVGDGDDNNAAPGAAWIATYSFNATGGTYKVLFRGQEQGSDSFWVRITTATAQSHEHPDQPGSGWVRFNEMDAPSGWAWDEVHSNDHNNEVVTWTLPAGANTIEVAKREDGAWLDAIVISKVD